MKMIGEGGAGSNPAKDTLIFYYFVIKRIIPMNKTQIELTLYDDESVREKLTVLDKMETMFDDGRNTIQDEYYDFVENLPLGSTIRITLEVIN